MNKNLPLKIPQDIEAEQAVLGAILSDNDLLGETAGILKSGSFYSLPHQYIFQAMIDLEELNQPIDEIILGDHLRSLNKLDEIGGYTYLAELIDCVPASANVTHYAKIVQEHALLRELISTTTDIAKKSRSAEQNISELLSEAETKITEIASRTASANYRHIRDVLASSFERLEKISETTEVVTGLPTGFIDLDKTTSGLQPSDLIIIAARPSMGKTAFALNIATHIALRAKSPSLVLRPEEKGAILIFSLEMSREQLATRMLTSISQVDAGKIRSGNLDQEDWDRLAMATDRLSGTSIFINDSTNLSPYELVAISKQLNKEYENGLSLVIVDYLQLMKGSKANTPREQEIAEISRSLKGLAKELSIPVIALSQLNRALENRSDKHPQLSDLRESGAIEQDADIIMFIYRDEVYNKETKDKGIAEIMIAKHRNGATGMQPLAFIGKYTQFANLTTRPEGE